MAYRAALGEEVGGAGEYRVGRRLIHPYYDLMACLGGRGGGGEGLGRFLIGMVGAAQPVFAWEDPLPGVAASTFRLGAFLRNMKGRRARAGADAHGA
jgi:hypothetical protein